MTTRHVIVGAGPAGINALETIRALDRDADIVLVGGEPAYARMVLPYYIEGRIEEQAVFTGDAAYFQERGVATRFGRTATGVDPQAGQIHLDDGEALAYDRLLLATGSRAAVPDVSGIDSPGVVSMWTLDDARSYLARDRAETVIVGAGFIAFTVLDAVAKRSERVTVVELAPRILPNMLDERAAALVQAHLADRGIEVHTDAGLEQIEERNGRRVLRLSSGKTLQCDAVVIATGVKPNVEFIAGSGIEINHGIPVDDHLLTSADRVFAAGDVAEGPDLLTGEKRVHAIQPTAVDHGRVAGANMAGADVGYSGSLTMNILAAQGLEACSFGRWQGDGLEVQAIENASGRIYRKYVWEDDKLVGGVLIGPSVAVSNVNDVGMLKGLIQTGVELSGWKSYLAENPLDLRRPFIASGAAKELLQSTLLTGRASTSRGFRFPALPAVRKRSPHHAGLVRGAPR